ncbi:hypothetical protein EXN66_Car013065 [Channa argus]|uniref:Uncharacterized protein n=1 Tax=Channa argus TaxID=215402 RepID=A0A6G1Q4C1_CHAAH|nr:hypothetical protein EXN66_Car013065 [Channa argus]
MDCQSNFAKTAMLMVTFTQQISTLYENLCNVTLLKVFHASAKHKLQYFHQLLLVYIEIREGEACKRF